jgi:prepilin-type N-terminal cleavage/methylation domain-containing protein
MRITTLEKSPCRRSRAGFTLIELLVVVAIIALLVSILLPALGRARQQAKAIVCRTQLRDLGMNTTMYANAERDAVPLNMFKNYGTSVYLNEVRGRDYPWPVLLLNYQDAQKNQHLCPSMPRDLYPKQEFALQSGWDYFEQDGKYATSYQMKPDLGSADFAPSMRELATSQPRFWTKFFKYWDNEKADGKLYVTLVNDAGSLASLGADAKYEVITRFSQIKSTSRVMLYSDRFEWHKMKVGTKSTEARQMVMVDGSAVMMPHKGGDIRTDYMLEGYWFRTAENMPVDPEDR